MTIQEDYSEGEWHSATGHLPLKNLSREQLLILHRAFIWANVQKSCADNELKRVAALGAMEFERHLVPASTMQSHYFAWYAFLYALIEGCEARDIDIQAPFGAEVVKMKKTLKEFRNAVFHVPRSRYSDKRLQALFGSSQTRADMIRRVHNGFSRLFYEEFGRRKALPSS